MIPVKYDLNDLVSSLVSFAGVDILNAGTGEIQLPNEVAFFRNTFRLNSQADGLGTEVTGFTLAEEVTSLTDFWGRSAYRKVKVTDPTYQSGHVYAFGDVAGSVIGAADINRLDDQVDALTAEAADHEARMDSLEDERPKNYLQNPLTRAGTAGVSSSGATSVAWDATATGVLLAGALKAIFPASGSGRYLDLALDPVNPADLGTPWWVELAYRLGTAADDLVTAYLYDGSVEVPLASGPLPYVGGLTQRLGAAALPTAVTSGLKLRLRVKDATAVTLWLADASVGPKAQAGGAAVGPTITYPLTIGATTTPPTKGTVAEDVATWARHGDKMLWSYRLRMTSAGTNGSGNYLFPLPTGYNVDLVRHPVGSAVGVCKLSSVTDEVSQYTALGLVVVHSGTQLKFLCTNPIATQQKLDDVGSGGFGLGLSATMSYAAQAEFTVSGWSSNVNLTTDFTEYAFNTQATINTNDTTSFGYGSGGAAILANTVAVYHDIQFTRPIQPTDKIEVEVRSKADGVWVPFVGAVVESLGTILTPGLITVTSGGTEYAYIAGMGVSRLSSAKLRVRFGAIAGVSRADRGWSAGASGTADTTWAQVASAADGFDRWRVRKVSNGNMAEQPPAVFADATLSTAPAVAKDVAIPFNVANSDTHGGLTVGTGARYTCKVPGLYSVKCFMYQAGVANALVHLWKNGVKYRVMLDTTSYTGDYGDVDLRLATGDYVDVRPDPGVTVNAMSWMQVTRIGA